MRPTTLLSRLGSEPGFTPTDRRSLERLTSRLPEATVAQLLGDRELRARAAELVSTNELILLFHSLSKWVRAEVPEPASASLSDYARNHGVAWCLDCKLERLAESGGSASFLVDRLRSARIGTVGALLDSRGLQGYLEPLRKQLAEIADKFVRKQVALVAEAVIHAPLTAPLPDHVEAARKQLWHHLHELSESLREHVTPRPTTERLTGELRLSEDPPVLTRFSRERSGSHSFNTLVPLRADVGQALACSCTAASPAVCDHALALVED